MLFLMFLKLRMGAPLLRLALSVVTFIVVYFILSIPEVFAASATRESSFAYDPNTGLLIQEVVEPNTPSLRVQTDYTYDAFGNKLSSSTSGIDIDSRTTSWTYDSSGQFLTSTINPLSHSNTFVTDKAFGVVTSQTDPNGLITTWQYDSFGRRSIEIRADGNRTNYSYSYCNGTAGGTELCPLQGAYVTKAIPIGPDGTTQNGPDITSFHDSHGRVIATDFKGFDNSTIRQELEFDTFGREIASTRPYFLMTEAPVWTTRLYDVIGRTKKVVLPDGTVTTTSFSGLTESVENGLGQIETTIKNPRDQIIAAIDSNGKVTTYEFDPHGNQVKISDSDGNVATSIFDEAGHEIGSSDPDLGVWTYTYNVLGELLTQTDAKGQTSTSTYDKLGRKLTLVESDLTTNWTYDTVTNGIGKLASSSSDNGFQRDLVYDSFGRVIQTSTKIDGVTETIASTFDANGRISTVTYPSGFSVQYLYTSLGFTNQLKNSVSGQVYWTADSLDAELRLTQHTLGNGVAVNYAFDPYRGYVNSIQAGGGASVANFSYVFDAIGNLTQRADAIENLTENFTYDVLNRLTQYEIVGGAVKTVQYNDIGNITYKSDVGTYLYPSAGSARPHAVSTISGTINTSYSYDANGAMTSGGGRTLTWTASRKVKTIAQGATTVTFDYDGDNRRVKKADSSGTTYYYRDQSVAGIMVEKHVGSTITQWNEYLYVGGEMVGQHFSRSDQTETTRYFVKDHLSSVAVLTDELGVVVERLSFDAWGKRRFPNGTDDATGSITSQTTRGFTGHEMIDEVGIVNMNGRIYDPQIGRFMSADPFIHDVNDSQDLNRYSYVHNNPLSYSDENGFGFFKKIGRFFKKIWKPLVAIAAAALFQFYIAPAVLGVSSFGAISSTFTQAVVTGISGGISNVIVTGKGKSFLTGFGQGFATFSVGHIVFGSTGVLSNVSTEFGKPGYFGKALAHGVVGGAFSEIRGGSFVSGFAAAGFASAAGPAYSENFSFRNVLVGTVAGGVGSVLGGGKFANGAVTGAFVYLFNHGVDVIRRNVTTWPVPGHNRIAGPNRSVGQGDGEFGYTRNSGSKLHKGIDILAPEGATVVAAGDGKVTVATTGVRGYGTTVYITHKDGSVTRYGHLKTYTVKTGQTVKAGDKIGEVGRTGNVPNKGQSHLHFEIRNRQGRPVDPRGVFSQTREQ